MFIDANYKCRDRKGWSSAKGILGKTIKTGVGEQIDELNKAFKAVNRSKLQRYLVAKDRVKEQAEAMAEMNKFPKIVAEANKLKNLCATAKTKKLSKDANTYLDTMIGECNRLPTLCKEYVEFEKKEWKK